MQVFNRVLKIGAVQQLPNDSHWFDITNIFATNAFDSDFRIK